VRDRAIRLKRSITDDELRALRNEHHAELAALA